MPIIGKQQLCSTPLSNFNKFVGFDGTLIYQNHSILTALISNNKIPKPYCDCFAEGEDDRHGNVIWWTEPWQETPVLYNDLPETSKQHYKTVFESTYQVYASAIQNIKVPTYAKILKDVLDTLSLDNAYCFDNKIVFVAWGMMLDTMKACTIGTIIVPLIETKHASKIKVEFGCVNGKLQDITKRLLFVDSGTAIEPSQVPAIIPDEGYSDVEWTPVSPIGYCVTQKMKFEAVCKPKKTTDDASSIHPIGGGTDAAPHKCSFVSGENGSLDGPDTQWVQDGRCLPDDAIPLINANNGYTFIGWDKDTQKPVYDDVTYTAKYKKMPWWRRFWLWLCGLGALIWGWLCGLWRWLVAHWWRLLLALLLLAALLFLLRCCDGCHRVALPLGPEDTEAAAIDPNVGRGGIYNPGDPYHPNPTDGAYDGVLPPSEGVLLPIGDEVIENPGGATIVANQINILMENEDRNIGDLAVKFKQLYPAAEYQVTYYDNVTKRMNVTVPVTERLSIKGKLPQQVAPEFEIFVFDEAMFEGTYIPNDPDFNSRRSWYMEKINVLKAWDITKGSPEISIAIVDNGFNLKHPEFKGRICGAYNVWRHSSKIDAHEVDHGTHVAGIALASIDNKTGCCGIAPQCMFIPVQVADDKDRMTTTSILDGILYSIYQGADVVNVSLGQSLNGLDAYPESAQQELIANHFKEEERLWRKVLQIAEKHHCVIVFAAGNDNVLAGIDPQQRSTACIVVSAINKKGQNITKADFSNYGSYSTISAPGVDIYSCYKSGYETESGTSMAAPVVSGVVALMKSVKRDLTIQEVRCILQSTGIASSDRIGPLVQAYEAVDMVAKGTPCTETETAEELVIHHGDVEISLTWDNENDLDLVCVDPAEDMIWFNNRASASGGALDVDMNCNNPYVRNPIEHIYWPVGGAPAGTYSVGVVYYAKHDRTVRTPYRVSVKANDCVQYYQGELTYPNKESVIPVCTFTVGK